MVNHDPSNTAPRDLYAYDPRHDRGVPRLPAPEPRAGIIRRIRRHIWRHFFAYCFLAIQVIFLIWVIGGTASASGDGGAHAEAAKFCANGGWRYLYSSQADCVAKYGDTLNTAGNIGTGIGVALVIGLWVAVDVILGISRIVVVLSRRRSDGRQS